MLKTIEQSVLAALPDILSLRSQRTEKPDGSFVTKGDLLVEEIVLAKANELVPSAIVISEEMKNYPDFESLATGDVLIVDPVDGTENFTSGLPEWGVSLSHYRNATHVESLIFCPELQLRVGTGQQLPQLESRIAGISSSLSKKDLLRLKSGYEYRIIGCCVYNMVNVVRGAYASFENPKGARVWDIIGGLNLALENDLRVMVEGNTYQGELLDPKIRYRFRIERSNQQGNLCVTP